MKTEERLEIRPHCFYRAAELEQAFGRRFLLNLREAGLRAVGGWYLGKTILESFERASDNRNRQRVPSTKGEETIGNTKKKEMAKDHSNGTVQRVSKHVRRESVRSQLEETRRQLRAETLHGGIAAEGY